MLNNFIKLLIMKESCSDCKYYLAVDVFKGICKVSKENIFPEHKSCKDFVQIAKCKFCKNYTNPTLPSPSKGEGGGGVGTCMGKTEAYPEMIATTCEYFKAN
jgi:hypothetical protein